MTALVENVLDGFQPSRLFRYYDMVPDEWQCEVMDDISKRIILIATRQGGKSWVSANKAVGGFLSYTDHLTILVARTLRQSAELMNKVQWMYSQIPNAPPVRKTALSMINERTANRIVAIPGGNPDNIRGFSKIDRVIIDEAAYAKDPLYSILRPMLMVSNGQLILISSAGVKSGFFYDIASKTNEELGEDWSRYRIDATQIPRFSKEALEKERKAIGPWWFNSEYMCMFQDPQDSLFTMEDIQRSITKQIKPLFTGTARVYNVPEDVPKALFGGRA